MELIRPTFTVKGSMGRFFLDKGASMQVCEVFVERDDAYYKWLDEHKEDGFVLNIGVRPNTMPGPYNQVLHLASCWPIAKHIPNRTGPIWKKVCSTHRDDLILFGQRQEDGQTPSFCKHCQP